jgi:hypothetical protein
MYNINVLSELGENLTISVVRFFSAMNNMYLIHSLNEKDEAGYIKLYVSKKVDNNFVKVEDENEWNQLKELIKVIVKEAKDNALLSVEDLDYKKITGLMISSSRVFKLTEQVTEMLGLNKKQFNEEVIVPVVETKPIEELFVEEDDEPQSFEELLAKSTPKVEEAPIKKLSTLEELLGQTLKEEPKVEVKAPVVETPIVEQPKEDLSKKVLELEAKVLDLENKLNQIKNILQ